MKTTRQGVICAALVIFTIGFSQQLSAQSQNVIDFISAAQTNGWFPPVTNQTIPFATNIPTGPIGTYWTVQTPRVPLPGNFFPELTVYEIDPTNHIYVVDDRSVDYPALRAWNESQSEGEFSLMSEGGGGGFEMLSMMYSSEDLWLEMIGVTWSDRTAYLVIHFPESETNGVYDLFSTTNLNPLVPGLNGTNWEWVLRCDPGQTNLTVTSLVGNECYFRLGRTNDTDGDFLTDAFELLVSHSDPTNPFTAGYGLPDLWEWNYFGNFLQTTNGDYDGDEHDNLTEFQNGWDPNKIRFSIAVTNRFVRSIGVPLQISIEGGVPSSMAIVIATNDFTTNDVFNAATWFPYTSDYQATIGLAEGHYDIWVGLRGRLTTSQQTWHAQGVLLDITPPTVTVVAPSNSVLAKPLAQIQGTASEELSNISYDLENTTETNLDMPAFVTSTTYNSNGVAAVSFQCFDVALAAGTNTITIRAADLAGNVTTNVQCYVFDSSAMTNAPMISVSWPTNNLVICVDDLLVRGAVDDETATVTAEVSTGGTTQEFPGAITRSGAFEIRGVPLQSGTNQISIQAVNANGLVGTQTVSIIRSPVSVILNPIPTTGTTVTVSGTISQPSWGVSANGISGTVNSNGTFTVDGVTNGSSGGTASVNVTVTPPGGNTNDSPAITVFVQDNPPTIHAASYWAYSHRDYAGWSDFCGGWFMYPFLDAHRTQRISWTNGVGGSWYFFSSGYNWDIQEWYSDSATLDLSGDEYEPLVGWPYPIPFEWSDYKTYIPPHSCEYTFDTRTRQAKTSIVLSTGGSGATRDFRLYRVKIIAWEFSGSPDGQFVQGYTGDVPLPPEWVQLKGIPLARGATNGDGSVWGEAYVTAPAGTNVDITPTVTRFYKNAFVSFQMEAEEAKLRIFAGTNDITGKTEDVVVGEKISLHCRPSITNVTLTDFQWTIPGYRISNYVANASSGTMYSNFPTTLSNIVFYWVDGANNREIECSASVQGQRVTNRATFNIMRPVPPDFYAQLRASVAADTNFHNYDLSAINGDIVDQGPREGSWLHLGINTSWADVGIAIGFSNAPTFAPDITYGRYFLVQIMEEGLIKKNQVSGTNIYGLQQERHGLDTSYPLLSVNNLWQPGGYSLRPDDKWPDSPASSLNGVTWLSRTDSFKAYLMFQPSPFTNSIPVPMWCATWSWSGVARTNGGFDSYTLIHQTLPSPVVYQTNGFPQWNTNITSFSFQTNAVLFDEN